MRNAFADELTTLAQGDSRIVLLSGDIGNKLFDSFKNNDQARFYNCGIAEANMMGVAAGLALSGLRPVVYTITPFTTTRCFEQIRIDVAYHEAPVIIIGTGSGLSYAELGPTHHSLEDLAILRTLPGLVILAPCDEVELRLGLRAAIKQSKPVYMRIGKKGEEKIHSSNPNFQIGKSIKIRNGKDVALIGTGTIMSTVIAAAKNLESNGISTEVVSMHTVKPLDIAYLDLISKANFSLVATVEEHGLIGGLGGAVAEWKSLTGSKLPHIQFGTPDSFMHEIGSQAYAREKYGLTSTNIANVIQLKFNELSN